MAATTTTEDLVKSSNRSVMLSVLMMAAGVLAICLPVIARVPVAVVVGWLLVASAVLHLAYSWQASEGGALWEVILAFVFEAAGVYLIANPVSAVAPLTLALAMCLVIEGILEFVLASQLAPDPGAGWLYLDGVLTFVLASLLWSTWPWPASATWKLGVLVGISMVLSGLTRLMISLAARKTVE